MENTKKTENTEMSKETIKIKNTMTTPEYMLLVDSLADAFYSTAGEYQPHVGELWAMAQFYNVCVQKSKIDEEFKTEDGSRKKADVMDVPILVSDREFVNAFYGEITNIAPELRFGCAYQNALEIVRQKNSSLGGITGIIINALGALKDKFEPLLSDENIGNLAKISEAVKKEENLAESIVDAYGKSQRFQEVISSGEKDEPKLEVVEKD